VVEIHYKKIDIGPQVFRIWASKFILSFDYVPWATRPNKLHLLQIRALKYFFCHLHVKFGCIIWILWHNVFILGPILIKQVEQISPKILNEIGTNQKKKCHGNKDRKKPTLSLSPFFSASVI